MSKPKKKLLYLSMDSGIPFWGTKGGSIHIREVIGAFVKKEIDVTVIAEKAESGSDEPTPYNRFDLPDVRKDLTLKLTRRLDPGRKFNKEIRDYIRNQYLFETCSTLHKKEKFDFIYERYSLFGMAGLSFAGKKSVPFILEVNAPLVDEAGKYRELNLKDLAVKIERYLFSSADHIVAVSNEMKKYILDSSPSAKVTVVPNGVRVDHFENSSTPQGSKNGLFTIGFLGSLKPWHGIEVLINSFADLVGRTDKAKLLIIGGTDTTVNDYKKHCAELGLDGHVEFTGSIEYTDVPGQLQRADVLVAPYPKLDEFYFSALKVFEYMATGKAIVASDIGQISSVVVNEKTALLVHPGDREALTSALERLLSDSNLRELLGTNALNVVRSEHTWDSRIDEILKIFSSVSSGKS
jgi:glycosyltransferase involved in cell wall biosynthesis